MEVGGLYSKEAEKRNSAWPLQLLALVYKFG